MPEQVNLMRASQEWANRPDDQRYLSLDELHAAVQARADASAVDILQHRHLTADGQQRMVEGEDMAGERTMQLQVTGSDTPVVPTHWSFSQLCSRARVPAAWARDDTHPQIAALAMNYGLQVKSPGTDSMLMTVEQNGHKVLRCITGPSYGRIYDHRVVEAVQQVNEDGRWKVPAASYTAQNPKLATTLYASDRDCFIFLVDPSTPIEIPRPGGGEPEVLWRGFYVWNSEVGKTTFGLTTFLYRYVCDNRIIWGAEDVSELRIRHTSGGPDRFVREGMPLLAKYAESTVGRTLEVAKRAMAMSVATTDDGVKDWLIRQRFNVKEAVRIIAKAQEEEGQARTVWDLVQGGTALARGLRHTDSRLQLEQRASALLKQVA